jgi:hypothetical protein
MRKIALAALLVVLATPAWAANEDVEDMQAAFKLWDAKATLCARSGGGSYGVWMIKAAPSEEWAVQQATTSLRAFCGTEQTDLCAETRAYIKQRWGY